MIAGAIILTLSIFFSANGFGVKVPDMVWVGWLFGIVITLVEIVWNKAGKSNLTIGIVGLAAYGYGIWTNVLGIQLANGIENIFSDISFLIFALIVSFFLEVSAEPLLIAGITGRADSDPISEMFGNVVSKAYPQVKHPGFITTPSGRKVPLPPLQPKE